MKHKNLITEEEKKEIITLHKEYLDEGFFDVLKGLYDKIIGGSKTAGSDIEKMLSKEKKSPVKMNKKSNVNIVIGDSQSPYVANGSDKFELISTQGGESSLWLGGKTLSWLLEAVKKHKGSEQVDNIAICIGTNGAFNPNDNISGLVSELKKKFPNANLFAIQGSWGWGGVKNVTEKKVKTYYKIFEDNGVKVVDPPIGKIEPHGNKPIYKEIGKKLDSLV